MDEDSKRKKIGDICTINEQRIVKKRYKIALKIFIVRLFKIKKKSLKIKFLSNQLNNKKHFVKTVKEIVIVLI